MLPEHDNLRVLLSIDLYKRKSIAERARAKEAWSSFCCKFRDEAACRKDLYIALKDSNFLSCRSCQSRDYQICSDLRRYACSPCGTINWVSSGTFFEGISNLRAWYAAFCFFGRGAIVSSRWFSFIVGVSQSTSLEIYWNVLHVLKEAWPSNGATVGSAHFVDLFVKRSVCSVRKAHPSMEERQEYLDYLSSVFQSRESEFAEECTESTGDSRAAKQSGSFDLSISLFSDSLSSAQSHESSLLGSEVSSLNCAADIGSSNVLGDIGIEIDTMVSLRDRLLNLLRQGPKTIDALIEALGVEANEVLAELSELEIFGFVRSLPGGSVGLSSESHSINGSHGFNQEADKSKGDRARARARDRARAGLAAGSAADSSETRSASDEGDRLHEWFQCSDHGCSICSPQSANGKLIQKLSEDVKFNIRRFFSGLSRKYLALYLQLNKLTGALQVEKKCNLSMKEREDRSSQAAPVLYSPEAMEDSNFRRIFESCLLNGKPEAECINRFVSPLMVSVPIFC